ncbi:uncharacterized protein K460DRAFT_403986 [Cucurbitaria berberidis CBS 394.84]|uniref:F-box domain-containing protein n=1 Tax=Cucurbitaria berberidis CBS 394.84 TaxID=1168544 RepID=A0A9P4GNB1_9PLEO|nr:uncharacterized protein K460DRAFT_403986 [Cucurbitaria berberidis CBS 394.84]KAF1848715.1 hypothetical protein K460DRAFT_403986 [Cucurbitaria berberidis CBS 394.84]
MASLTTITSELQIHIARHLDIEALLALSLVSKQLCSIAQDVLYVDVSLQENITENAKVHSDIRSFYYTMKTRPHLCRRVRHLSMVPHDARLKLIVPAEIFTGLGLVPAVIIKVSEAALAGILLTMLPNLTSLNMTMIAYDQNGEMPILASNPIQRLFGTEFDPQQLRNIPGLKKVETLRLWAPTIESHWMTLPQLSQLYLHPEGIRALSDRGAGLLEIESVVELLPLSLPKLTALSLTVKTTWLTPQNRPQNHSQPVHGFPELLRRLPGITNLEIFFENSEDAGDMSSVTDCNELGKTLAVFTQTLRALTIHTLPDDGQILPIQRLNHFTKLQELSISEDALLDDNTHLEYADEPGMPPITQLPPQLERLEIFRVSERVLEFWDFLISNVEGFPNLKTVVLHTDLRRTRIPVWRVGGSYLGYTQTRLEKWLSWVVEFSFRDVGLDVVVWYLGEE